MLNTVPSSLKDLHQLVTSTVILDNVSAALFSQIKIFSNYPSLVSCFDYLFNNFVKQV